MARTATARITIAPALVGLYLVVAALTSTWSPDQVRPLFDGFGSHSGRYSWVNPPKEFSEGNQRPDVSTAQIVFEGDTSSPASAETRDGQVLAGLVEGSLAPNPPDTAARITVTPLDSAKLGALPPGLRAESNAYRVQVMYQPSQTQATTLIKPGTVGLISAAPADTLLYSPDGERWQALQGRPLAQGNGLTAPLTEPGYYLIAGKGEPRAGSSSGSPPFALYVLAGLVPLILGYLLLNKRGQTKTSPAGRPASRRQSAPPPRPSRRAPPAKKRKRK